MNPGKLCGGVYHVALVATVIALLTTAAAAGRPPFDRPTAKGGLPRCKADLSRAHRDVALYAAEFDICSRNLDASQTAVAQAQLEIDACEAELAACSGEDAHGALVAQTGQTTCYGATSFPFGLVWDEIDCDAEAADGQDGQLQLGAMPPNPRFTDPGDGTVVDEWTGLVWLKDWSCAGLPKTWTDALAFANGLQDGQCGLLDGSQAGDWHLPNRNELLTVVDISIVSPAVPRAENDNPVFDNVGGSYWSSSTYANFGGKYAWVINFNDGTVNFLGKGVKAPAIAVRDTVPNP